MLKNFKVIVFLGLFVFPVIIFCSSKRLENIKIIEYSDKTVSLGLNDVDIWSNGELNVIKNLIRPGDLVFDVGANIGDWSNHVFYNSKPSLIYSFEPVKSVCDKLVDNLKNKNAIVNNLALSNYVGVKTFYHYPTASALSGFYDRAIIRRDDHIAPEEILVSVDSLDSFCQKNNILHIDFLKIDTEGEEFNILLGAKNLLQQKRISMIQFEYGGTYIDAKITLSQIYNLLSTYGYYIFRIINDGLVEIKQWKDDLENSQYSNYLAVLDW